MRIIPYTTDWYERWDELVKSSSQGTFLHLRGYMDYHADRFTDVSLLAVDDRDRVVAALPACESGDKVVSHGGLTYGGWLTVARRVDGSSLLEIFNLAQEHYARLGYKSLCYKQIPTIYHRYPSQEDDYALFRLGAETTAVGLSSAIDLSRPLAFDTNAKRSVAFAAKKFVTIRENADVNQFWELLTALLADRYKTAPVHTPAEMTLLMSRFPDNIKVWGAYCGEELVAGVVMYLTDTVAHAQYIGASPRGKELKALPLLFSRLIERYSSEGYRYFDFGISTEDGGRYLNAGLLRQKSGMGGRGVAYRQYEVKVL